MIIRIHPLTHAIRVALMQRAHDACTAAPSASDARANPAPLDVKGDKPRACEARGEDAGKRYSLASPYAGGTAANSR